MVISINGNGEKKCGGNEKKCAGEGRGDIKDVYKNG